MLGKIERHDEILRLVNTEGKVLVATLANLFTVSKVTIREDLTNLAGKKLVQRCHGGAIFLSNLARILNSYEETTKDYHCNKFALAAVKLINNGDSIILDSNITSEYIAYNLQKHQGLTVLTNGLKVAMKLAEIDDIEIMLTGGKLRKQSQSLFGRLAENNLQQYHFDKTILYVDYFDLSVGISTGSAQKASLEELMLKISSEIIVICKSVNFGKSSFHVIPNNQKISTIITDGNIKENEIEVIENTGIKLIITD